MTADTAGGTPSDASAPDASLNASGRAVARNALSGYVTLALGAALGFVLTPILLQQLGQAGFGTWSLVIGAMTYLGLLEAGLGLATITRVAATEAEGPRALSRVLSTSMALVSGVAALGLVVTVGLALVFPVIFDVQDDLRAESRVAVLLAGTWQCLIILASAYSASLLGTGRMYLANLSGFAVAAVVTVGQAALVLTGGGLREIAAAQLVGGFATLWVLRGQARRSLPGVVISPRRADRGVAKQLLSLGWRNSVSSVTGTLAFGSDVVLVGLLLDPLAAAAYAVGLRAYTLMHRVSTGVGSALGPSHAHAATFSSAERRFRLYCLSVGLSLVLALLAAIAAGFYAEPLLDLWLVEVPRDATAVLVVLCAVLILQMPGHSAYQLLLNSERAAELMRVMLAAAATNVVASVIFTMAFGTIGPALGSLLAVTIFDAVYLPWRICAILERSYSELVRTVFAPLLIPTLALLAVLGAGKALSVDGPVVLVVATLGAVVFIASWWFTQTAADVRAILLADRRATAEAGAAAR